MSERRKHSRIPVRLRFKIIHPDVGEKIVHTRDLSEGGLYVITDPADLPARGAVVKGQMLDTEVEAPVIEMKIVHVGKNGLGLEYINS